MTDLIPKPESLLPTTFEQMERYADKIANSSLCPSAFKGKGGDVLIAIQMGYEIGLAPMQALQNISVINGRPSVWGDAMIGIARAHPHCESIREWFEGKGDDMTALCGVTRKGQAEEIRSFSVANAKKAGLWGKAGPWSQYPERMLQMRARGFAVRDVFADALRGLSLAEEMQDHPHHAAYVQAEVINQKIEKGIPLSLSDTTSEEVIQKYKDAISCATNIEMLKIIYADFRKEITNDKETLDVLTKLLSEKKASFKSGNSLSSLGECNE